MSDAAQTLLEAYLQYRPDLLRHFTARLKSAAAAEDLVQDIYVRLRSHPAPERIDNAAAYLFRMGSNLLVDTVRSELRAAARDTAWRDSEVTVAGRDPPTSRPPTRRWPPASGWRRWSGRWPTCPPRRPASSACTSSRTCPTPRPPRCWACPSAP